MNPIIDNPLQCHGLQVGSVPDTLFMMPSWQAYSEVWLQRMLLLLEPRLMGIAANDAEPHWGATKVPGISLCPTGSWKLRFLAKALGQRWENAYRTRVVRRSLDQINRSDLNGSLRFVLCNFVSFAIYWHNELRLQNAKWLVHCHGCDVAWDGFSETSPYPPLHPTDYPEQVRELARNAHFIANSHYTRGKLLEMGVPENRIFVKYFGVETEAIDRAKSPDRSLKIVYLGRLVDLKGPDLVIQAFLLAISRGLKGILTFAGDGPMRNTCELLARRSQHGNLIHFLGAVSREKAGELLRQADVFTHHHCVGPLSNREEAFGVSLIEAMGAGLPVVTGNSGGVSESVIHGQTGYLVAPGDVAAHAQALLDLQNPDLRHQLGRSAYVRVRETFSLEKETKQLSDIFSSIND